MESELAVCLLYISLSDFLMLKWKLGHVDLENAT